MNLYLHYKFNFTSCAAGILVSPILLVVLGMLATMVTGGHHVEHLLAMMVLQILVLTPSTFMAYLSSRQVVRISAGAATPSAALVLY